MVKSLPAVQETRVQSLGREDALEKEMATHFSIPCLENSKEVPSVLASSVCWSLQCLIFASLVAQRLKHLLPMQETQVRSLGREDPLEKEMVTHSSILAWRIPWKEKPGRLQSVGSQRVGHN